MEGIVEYILLLVSQFAGGPGPIENNLMRFGLPAVMWAGLFFVAWSRQRANARPREKWLLWGFGIAFARELFMFAFISLQITGTIERNSAYFISAPLEQALTMAAIVVIAAAFLRYILDDEVIARRYLTIGLLVTLICYLATFWWWAQFSLANPAARFGRTWVSGLFHLVSALLIIWAMVILYKTKGWLRNVMMIALFFFLIADLIKLASLPLDEVSSHAISHTFYILAIPLLGYIYIREQSIEREDAVSAWRENEMRLRDIIDYTQAGYFFMDREGRYLKVNNAWLQMHGYESDAEVLGKHFSMTQPQNIAPGMQDEINKLISGEQVPTSESMRLTKDGTVKVHTSSSNPVIVGGQVVGLEGFLIDRTEQVEAEAVALRRKEQMAVLYAIAETISKTHDLQRMLVSILENVLVVTNMDAGWVYIYDDEGHLRMLAERGIQAVDGSSSHIIDVEDNPIQYIANSGKPLETMIANDAMWSGQLLCGHECDHRFAGVPLFFRDQVQGVLAVLGCGTKNVVHEVELLSTIAQQIEIAIEKTQLAEEASRVKLLQELDRLRSELIANVSHDLRTPLGLIRLSSTSLMADDVRFDENTRRQMLDIILDETVRLEKIVDDLLLLAQIESGQIVLHKRLTPLHELIKQATSGMDSPMMGHEIIQEVVPPSLSIQLDPDRMEQVLRNLISNAIKYSPDGGSIHIEAFADSRQVYITVTDQGIGLPEEELERVFDRFYRLDNPITRQERGTGLGLAVCRNMVEAHGGRIWMNSRLGKGTKVYITLPENGRREDIQAAQELVSA